MAKKTVIKALLSKWGVMSIDMQKAVQFDQAVIKEDETPVYVDATSSTPQDEIIEDRPFGADAEAA